MTGVNVGTRRLGTPREAAGFRGGKAREKAGYSSASLSQQLQTFGNFFQDISLPLFPPPLSCVSPTPLPLPLTISPLSTTLLSPPIPFPASYPLHSPTH